MDMVRCAAFGCLLLMAGAAPFAASAEELDAQTRSDIMLLIGAGIGPSGVAAYCQTKVGKFPELVEAAVQWNRRNDEAAKLVTSAVNRFGPLSNELKNMMDLVGGRLVKSMVEADGDPATTCAAYKDVIASRESDLDVREDTAPALARLRKRLGR